MKPFIERFMPGSIWQGATYFYEITLPADSMGSFIKFVAHLIERYGREVQTVVLKME